MARYKKRNDGRYARQFKVGYQPDGRPKYKTIYAKTQAELERKIYIPATEECIAFAELLHTERHL